MNELLAFSSLSYLDDDLIEESCALLAPAAKPARVGGRRLLTGAMIFLGSGWCVAAVCAVVSIGILAGMIWLGRQPFDPTISPGGTDTPTAETTEPADTEGATDPESETEGILHPEITEGGIIFISHGDGTCKIKGADRTVTGKITVPERSPYGDVVTTVATGAFKGFREITEVSLPDTVTVIKGSAFQGCGALQSVTLPPEVTEFGRSMFDGCGQLQSVVLPKGVTEIGMATFQTCVNLKTVVARDRITSIGANAFNGCRSLSSLTLEKGGLTSIGASAFLNCCGLTTVYYGGSRTEWERVEIHPTDNAYIKRVNVVYIG
jgi:hypothetical protein